MNIEKTSEKCEKCGSAMMIKLGRYGKFLSCSNYPKCKNAKPLAKNEETNTPDPIDEELRQKFSRKKCEKCGKLMEIKRGPYGNFLGCSGYPECKNIKPIVKYTGVKCATCGDGQLVERRTRKGGRLFYGCNRFPKCKYATWEKPAGMDSKK